MAFRISSSLWEKIHHFASFPQTGGKHDLTLIINAPHTHLYITVSLQQMVLFGQNPSQGTLLKASQFLLGTWHPPPLLLRKSLIRILLQRSCPLDWHTGSGNSMSCHIISVKCLLSTRSRIGTLNHSRFVLITRDSSSIPRSTHIDF